MVSPIRLLVRLLQDAYAFNKDNHARTLQRPVGVRFLFRPFTILAHDTNSRFKTRPFDHWSTAEALK